MIMDNRIRTNKIEKEFIEDVNGDKGHEGINAQDIYMMFYTLLRQSQQLKPGSKMSFDLRVFKTLPKNLNVQFLKQNGRLFAWIPDENMPKPKKKSNLILPSDNVISN